MAGVTAMSAEYAPSPKTEMKSETAIEMSVPPPWNLPGWFGSRVRELVWTLFSVLPLAMFILLGALVYTAVRTTRPTTDLQIAFLGIVGIYAARRVGQVLADAKSEQLVKK